MGNKQSDSSEQEKNQNQEEEHLQQSQVQTPEPMFTIETSRKTELTYPFYDESPAKINVIINGITFWSNYDSGNLSKVECVDQNTFNLSIAGDCQGRNPKLLFNKGARLWFNFKVKSDQDRSVNFNIINIATRFKTIWQYDSDIFVKVNKKWQRYQAIYQTFQVKFNFEFAANQIVKFAYVPPWSYKKNQKYLDLYSSLLNQQIYFRRETIAKSFEGRDIELLTITNQADSQVTDYFCKEFLFPNRDQNSPPQKFNKPCILITARIHAGEVPSSFILKGILEQLGQYTDNARYLLENYVFLIIPMLNPDGVYRGHYRLDSLGYDQNRIYNRLIKYPKFNGPLAVLEIVKHHNVAIFIDLHSHSTLTNSFIFTNWNPNPQLNAAIQEFPRQMKQLVEHFRLKEALTTEIHYEKNQYEIEGQYTENEQVYIDNLLIHQSKENLVANSPCYSNPFAVNPYLTGVGKSDVYLTTKTLFCYTLEINYRVYKKSNQIIKYEVIDYENLGRDILTSLCNIHNNPNFKAIQIQYI